MGLYKDPQADYRMWEADVARYGDCEPRMQVIEDLPRAKDTITIIQPTGNSVQKPEA